MVKNTTDFNDPSLEYYNLDWIKACIDENNKPKAYVNNRDTYEEMVLAVLMGKRFIELVDALGVTREQVAIKINVPKARIDRLATGHLRELSATTLVKFFLEYKIMPTTFFHQVMKAFTYYQTIGVDKHIKPHQIMLKHGDNL